MLNSIFYIIGYIGAGFIGGMQIPQIYHTHKSGKVKDISLYTLIMNFIASACMINYSIYFKLYPVVIANSCVATCDIVLFTLYAKYTFQWKLTKSPEQMVVLP